MWARLIFKSEETIETLSDVIIGMKWYHHGNQDGALQILWGWGLLRRFNQPPCFSPRCAQCPISNDTLFSPLSLPVLNSHKNEHQFAALHTCCK